MRLEKNIKKISYSFINILPTSDLSSRRLPLMMIEANKPGPVVWLTACSHGDEVGGMVVIQEIFKEIKKSLIKGTLYAFPLMNPIGFENSSRYISLSEEDLNRSFPGKKKGSLSERIAEVIFSQILATKPDLVLDLHNDWIKSLPFVLLDHLPEQKYTQVCQKIKLFSQKTSLLTVIDTEDIKGALSTSLIEKNIPSITLELGESYIINEKDVGIGKKSIINILASLGMINSSREDYLYPITQQLRNFSEGKTLKYFHQFSSTSGIIRFLIEPGDIVKEGQPIARTYNAFGKLQEVITANKDSVVLGHSDYSVAFPGAVIISFAY